jgi:uncharacterized protein (TIGR00369 family)
MRKIVNPFAADSHEDYNCFGCSPHNENGLQMQFFDTGEGLISHWKPGLNYSGYPGIIHGGIQATLLDEIAAWTVYVKCETSGVTQDMKITFHLPLRLNKGEVTINAKVVEKTDKNAVLLAQITDGEGKLCSEAILNYFLYPLNIAVKRFKYPGVKAFYDDENIK